MADSALTPLPFAVLKTNRMQNAPIWCNRYRPSFVSRTASENRRKALVDYLAVSAGSKVNDDNFPNAVKHERESRYVQKQSRGRHMPLITRERSDISSTAHTLRSQSPPSAIPVTSSSIFLTQLPGNMMPSSEQAKYINSNSIYQGKFSSLRSIRVQSPTSQLTCFPTNSVSNSPQPQRNTPFTPATIQTDNSALSFSPPKDTEPYFSQWRKEFWSAEASKRGKIHYFQVTRSVPLTSRPQNAYSAPQREHDSSRHHKSDESSMDLLHSPPPKPAEPEQQKPKEAAPARPSENKASKKEKGPSQSQISNSSWPEYPVVEAFLETGDGSFPLSYVELRPVSAQRTAPDGGKSKHTGSQPRQNSPQLPLGSEVECETLNETEVELNQNEEMLLQTNNNEEPVVTEPDAEDIKTTMEALAVSSIGNETLEQADKSVQPETEIKQDIFNEEPQAQQINDDDPAVDNNSYELQTPTITVTEEEDYEYP